MAELTVLGIGNILMRDDGVGIRVLEAVRRARDWPAEIEFIDGGARGLNLLGVIESAKGLVVFDAADMQLPAGQHRLVTPGDLSDQPSGRISLHDVSFVQTLELCRQFFTAPNSVVILAIQPAEVSHGRELSAELQGEFDRLVQAAVAVVESQWHRLTGLGGPVPKGRED